MCVVTRSSTLNNRGSQQIVRTERLGQKTTSQSTQQKYSDQMPSSKREPSKEHSVKLPIGI